jgi:hypothetical protein
LSLTSTLQFTAFQYVSLWLNSFLAGILSLALIRALAAGPYPYQAPAVVQPVGSDRSRHRGSLLNSAKDSHSKGSTNPRLKLALTTARRNYSTSSDNPADPGRTSNGRRRREKGNPKYTNHYKKTMTVSNSLTRLS